MVSRMRQTLTVWIQRFYAQSPRQQAQPLNKLSLGIIIVIDIFILWQVFSGLSDIARWPLSPSQAYPCYSAWYAYREQTTESQPNRDFAQVRTALENASNDSLELQYRRQAQDRLGQLSPVCLDYAARRDAMVTPSSRNTLTRIKQQEQAIDSLAAANRQIRQEYDSTLLEQIAGQAPSQSINTVAAAQARQTLQANEEKIQTLKQDIQQLQQTLLQQPNSQKFIQFLQEDSAFQAVQQGYDRARFWHPTQQLILQVLFLAPLIGIAGWVQGWAWQRQFGLLALISWHLFIIFLIPLVLKIFEVLQFGAVFSVVFGLVTTLFGQLLFLVSYVYIFLIPLVGFGLIKLGQRLFFHPATQASNRYQKCRCLQCGRKIRLADPHCPHCGFHQYQDCPHCHQPTYTYLPHCKECGTPLEQSGHS
ncbi:hypothetical protein RIF25_11060 [Thermosynechococcaceae cyanobacterium BACA0444]|uniref:Zinc ribbon domain-containing protein n=1 Tax=Pseudocalidococcus azoricus BACA0444 TaxID=2918990 RepID=A0AAE4FUC1_9CYAN|nr:hypothetical protein [Pseudocalidococcus azoricus]MDS3861347.1 hypothetical protein [Pseudocalidococcus azoricus BACA0444]